MREVHKGVEVDRYIGLEGLEGLGIFSISKIEMLSLVNLSPRDEQQIKGSTSRVRQLIFECKRQARWGKLEEARGLVIAKNARRSSRSGTRRTKSI